MKKKIRNYVMALLAVVLCVNLSSCNKDDEGKNWAPVNKTWTQIMILVQVQDAEGNDLLNSKNAASIVNQGITATFMGVTYKLNENYKIDPSTNKAEGFFISEYGDQPSLLSFGYTAVTKIFSEDLVIDWGDGTTFTVTIRNDVVTNDGNTPYNKLEFFINGESRELNYIPFSLVKNPKKN